MSLLNLPLRILRLLTSGIPRRLAVIRLAWIFIVIWCEIGVFYFSVADCHWPTPGIHATPHSHISSHASSQSSAATHPNTQPTHILLIADPQILDHNSYPGRNPLLMSLTQFLVDFNLRKAWKVARDLRPRADVVIFLGDMTDNGRAEMSDEEYQAYVQRFRSIFHPIPNAPVYYLPGNHDVGLGDGVLTSQHAQSRYLSSFGPLNQYHTIANHTLVFVDSMSLVAKERSIGGVKVVDGDVLPKELDEAKFWPSVASGKPLQPLVLFTHIPLSRPEHSSCGPLREKGRITQGHGLGYQNELSPAMSDILLDTFRPSIVFSGDDHDYCEFMHDLPNKGDSHHDNHHPTPSRVREVTVKSLSMAMGIRQPGFHLLSLLPLDFSSSTGTPLSTYDAPISIADRPCLLPNQLNVYLAMYTPLFIFTLLLIFYLTALSEYDTSYVPARGGYGKGRGGIAMGSKYDYERSSPTGYRRSDDEGRWSPSPRGSPLSSPGRGAQRGSVGGLARKCSGMKESVRQSGLFGRFLCDLWSVAWPPVVVWVFIVVAVFW